MSRPAPTLPFARRPAPAPVSAPGDGDGDGDGDSHAAASVSQRRSSAVRGSSSRSRARSGGVPGQPGRGLRPRVPRFYRLWTVALSIATGLVAAVWAVGARE